MKSPYNIEGDLYENHVDVIMAGSMQKSHQEYQATKNQRCQVSRAPIGKSGPPGLPAKI